jgi:sialate O-acetylesterase
MSARASLIFVSLLASPAAAAPAIDPQFGNHAVIQRGKPIVLSGTAAPDEPVAVSLGGQVRHLVADREGTWAASFPGRGAGGPYTIDVAGAGGAKAASVDVMVGDVWLCSGQSNMEFPVRRALDSDGEVQNANDPDLRLFKVPQQVADDPQAHFAKPPQWRLTSPDSVKDFSAACYFMVRDLRASQHVAIGAIDDSWGATPIRQWMDEASVHAGGEGAIADLVRLHRTNPSQALRQFDATWVKWWDSQAGTPVGQEPWRASDGLAWQLVPQIDYWDSWGPDWKNHIGAVWFRRRFSLTPAQAEEGANLSLGVFDDMDQTWVNGVPVGGTSDWAAQRVYPMPPGLLHAGTNEIVIYVLNTYGAGGFAGPAANVHLDFDGSPALPLGDQWQYSRIDKAIANGPTPPWSGVASVSKIYNAMVAPLGPLGLKGVAWYQGEADVSVPGYDRRLAAWMADWRGQFRDPNLAFLIVGLAGWGKPTSKPVESGWAALINEQRLGAQHDPHAALISAIDIGIPTDLHPPNKQEVGRRLSLAAKQLAYDAAGAVGPMPIDAMASGPGMIVVRFSKPLQSIGGLGALGFELCGGLPSRCRYADARVHGSQVDIAWTDNDPVAEVRYAWADSPIVNLYDLDLLPVPVFELPLSVIVTGGLQ